MSVLTGGVMLGPCHLESLPSTVALPKTAIRGITPAAEPFVLTSPIQLDSWPVLLGCMTPDVSLLFAILWVYFSQQFRSYSHSFV